MTFENFNAPRDADASAKMECGVCWHVYDPAIGDDVWQIPPGVSFGALPSDWRCPNCDAPQAKFLRLADERDD